MIKNIDINKDYKHLLSRHNTQRQSIEAKMYQDAKALVEKKLKEEKEEVTKEEKENKESTE